MCVSICIQASGAFPSVKHKIEWGAARRMHCSTACHFHCQTPLSSTCCRRPGVGVVTRAASAGVVSYATDSAEVLQTARTLSVVGSDSATEDCGRLGMELLKSRDVLSGCEPSAAPLRVAMLLSGGVDSSLALRLLQRAGHRVTAFYLQIWFQEDFRNFWDACPWESDLEVCRQVCQEAGVPLQVVSLTQQYWDRVVAHSITEIRAGRTPNPDILCNSRVKFGAFYEYLETHHSGAFDRVASGHYARLLRDADASHDSGLVRMALCPDRVKDQTYFLAHLTQHQLARVMFPLGPFTKAEVRQLAAAMQLPNQARPDSQGICFLGKVKFAEFVREHLGEWPGLLIEEDSDSVLGYHEGSWFYTVGQRKGIHFSGGPWYVTHKNIDTNTVYVSRHYYAPNRRRDAFRCGDFNWILGRGPQPNVPVHCRVRHGPRLYVCEFTLDCDASAAGGGQTACVVLDDNDQGLAPGQYAVFYQEGVCLGSAVIQEALCTG